MDELIKDLRIYANDETDEIRFKAADAIEQLSNAGSAYGRGWTLGYDAGREESKPRWIPVTERLPESQGPFLTRYGFGDASIETGQFFYGVLYYLYADADPHWQHESVGVEVTHWMPLPEPPKEE